jgi:integrase
MKRPRRGPLIVQIGDARARIYRDSYCKIVRGRRRRYQRFTVAHYRLDGEKRKRFRQSFASLEDARFEATRIATAVANGEGDVLKLRSGDRATYLHAIGALRPLKMPLHVAIGEYVEARRHAGGASLIAAAKEYAQRHAGALVCKSVAEVVKELLAAKEQDGMSVRYLQTLRSHLNRFSQRLQMNISTVTAAQIEDWLRRTKRGPRTRNNIRLSIITLFNFGKARGYLSKALPTEAEHVAKAKDRGGKIGIFRPEQLAGLLTAGNEEAKLYLALGAFTGLRRSELLRLEWEDVKFERGKIEVGKDKSKTATRRLVPIQPNLVQWLASYRDRTGQVFASEDVANRTVAYAKDAGAEWPSNALRHSYATYRLAQCQDPARVALEMGNSPQILFHNYRELADEQDAAAWFSIAPTPVPNVLPMKRVRMAIAK